MVRLELVLVLLCLGAAAAQTFMARDGRELRLGGKEVFLAGADAAGGGTVEELNKLMDDLLRAGGNTLRVAVPRSSEARVTSLRRLLERAGERGVLLLLLLWPAQDHVPQGERAQMVANAVVRPMVEQLRPYQALGGWQVAEQTSCLAAGELLAVAAVEAVIREEDKKALIVRTARPGCDDYESADILLSHNGPTTADLPTVHMLACCDDVSTAARETRGQGLLAAPGCWEAALAARAADDFRLAFPPRRRARSWYKRPTLIYNPDEDLQAWVRGEKDAEEQAEDGEQKHEDSEQKERDSEQKDNSTAKKE